MMDKSLELQIAEYEQINKAGRMSEQYRAWNEKQVDLLRKMVELEEELAEHNACLEDVDSFYHK